jgi:hypothetical protein
MPEIRPFRGLTFSRPDTDTGALLSAPAVYERPPAPPTSGEPAEPGVLPLLFPPHDSAADTQALLTASWRRSGVLRRDDPPCWYLLSQSFRPPGAGLVERMGLVALCRMGEAGSGWLSTYQQTSPALLEEAVRRLRLTRMHLEPLVFLDGAMAPCIARVAAAARGQAPLLEVVFDRAIHRLWRVPAEDVPDLPGCAGGTDAPFLASGHHLYHAAQTFRDIMRLERRGVTAPWDFVPAVFFPQDPAAVELRSSVVIIRRKTPVVWEEILPLLGRSFGLTAAESLPALADAVQAGPGFAAGVAGADRTLLLTGDGLTLREGRELLEQILGEPEGPQAGGFRWMPDPAEAASHLRRRPSDLALLLKTPRMDDLLRAARDRQPLPPLSVSVGPTVPAGLIMAALDEWVP